MDVGGNRVNNKCLALLVWASVSSSEKCRRGYVPFEISIPFRELRLFGSLHPPAVLMSSVRETGRQCLGVGGVCSKQNSFIVEASIDFNQFPYRIRGKS